MGTKDDEIGTFKELLRKYPTGILSVVSDTWDLWKVCTEYVTELKEIILSRDGKLVIRPDSGNPVDIICGYFDPQQTDLPASIGVIELLWNVFGGTINSKGYKELDSHIGAIYGDSITLERAKEICERLKAKGFASTNIVFGIGSYTYQYNTRDTFGFAMKATYGEVTYRHDSDGYMVDCREIFKDPITDDGTKRSKKGLLKVTYDDNMNIVCADQCNKEQEKEGLLETVFFNGKLVKETTLQEIRDRLK